MEEVLSFKEYKQWQGSWFTNKYTEKQQWLLYLIYKFEKEHGEPLISFTSNLYNIEWLKQRVISLNKRIKISNFDEILKAIADVKEEL